MIKVMSFLDKMTVLVGRHVTVTVSNGNTSASKVLKVCKANSCSVLFIDVDRANRLNTFRKFRMKDIDYVTTSDDGVITVKFKTNVMPDRWESSWDSIGQLSPAVANSFGRRTFSNHSKGWAPKLPSTTNSAAGFPMV